MPRAPRNIGKLQRRVTAQLLDIMAASGVTQSTLCARTGVEQSVLSRILRNEATLDVTQLGVLCQGLGVTAAEVVAAAEAATVAPPDPPEPDFFALAAKHSPYPPEREGEERFNNQP